jgi:hypothetical protein
MYLFVLYNAMLYITSASIHANEPSRCYDLFTFIYSLFALAFPQVDCGEGFMAKSNVSNVVAIS